MRNRVVTLDVRPEIQRGQEPFSKIMRAVSQLKPGECLRLIAPFEPAPLYSVLATHGFSHQSQSTPAGDWEVLFSPASNSDAVASPGAPEAGAETNRANPEFIEVDARGLEPPQPLVTILEALAQLTPGQELRARTDRRPMHLYPQLETRGFRGETEVQTDGSYLTHIRTCATR